MEYKYHWIQNFPKKAGLFWKIWANLVFFIGVTQFSFRKNKLKAKNLKILLERAKKGDIILLGAHRKLAALFIGGKYTHSSIYTGNGLCVHANADGVEEITLEAIFKEYDSIQCLRIQEKFSINKLLDFLKCNLGKPYDYEFVLEKNHPKAFYCSELVYDAFKAAGVEIQIPENSRLHPMFFRKIGALDVFKC